MTTPTRLRQVGEALYGPRWQSDLARALKLSDRHVRRWVSGSTPVPPRVYDDLRRLCRERVAEIGRLLSSMDRG